MMEKTREKKKRYGGILAELSISILKPPPMTYKLLETLLAHILEHILVWKNVRDEPSSHGLLLLNIKSEKKERKRKCVPGGMMTVVKPLFTSVPPSSKQPLVCMRNRQCDEQNALRVRVLAPYTRLNSAFNFSSRVQAGMHNTHDALKTLQSKSGTWPCQGKDTPSYPPHLGIEDQIKHPGLY